MVKYLLIDTLSHHLYTIHNPSQRRPHMINAKQLGYRIKLEREKKHLTQEQLGTAINYTKQQISNWERGISMPSADILQELSRLLNINLLAELAHQGYLFRFIRRICSNRNYR